MTDKITHLVQKDKFQKEEDCFKEIINTINTYQGQISLVSVLGVLDIVADEIKLQAKVNQNGHKK